MGYGSSNLEEPSFSGSDKVVLFPVKVLRMTGFYSCIGLLTLVQFVSWFFGFSFDWELDERSIWKW